ncbi:clotting factor G beta subunit-like [Panonychus citri]|uniref:clotting factor G beta subunit-like n=1 Tax=Panonychus citri TaxID=50023 RepID=UPI002307DE7D|nr:clotting factor G beta subunit-like [Panonychus citri]
MFKLFLSIILLQLTHHNYGRTIFPINEKNENDQCISHNGVQGKCILITSCPALSKCLHQHDHHPTICSWDRHYPIVCCPSFNPRIDPSNRTTNEPTTTIIKHESSGKLKQKVNCGIKPFIPSLYVVGGNEVKSALDWPWMAALFTKPQTVGSSASSNNYNHFCGGTIISENCILTAAHCVHSFTGKRISELYVGIGSNELEKTIKLPIKKIILHPNYVSTKSYYDIALLITSKTITFTDTITPICLPGSSFINLTNNVNSSSDLNNIEVAGWGRLSYHGRSSHKLRSARLEIVPNQQCNQSYVNLNSSSIPEGIKSDQLCAGTSEGERDSCQGDSGGPLTMRAPSEDEFNLDVHYQIGLISFGRGCAVKEYPGVYTRITDYVPWIDKQLKPKTGRIVFE